MRTKAFHLLAPMICVWLSACTEPAPRQCEIVGTWIRAGGGRVTFLPNGRFIARNVPAKALLSLAADPNGPPRIDVNGKWRLMDPPGRIDLGRHDWPIELLVGPVPGHLLVGAELQPVYSKFWGVAMALDGDPDDPTFYTKAQPSDDLKSGGSTE